MRSAASFGTVGLTQTTLEATFELFKRLDTDGSGGLNGADIEALDKCLCPADVQRVTRRKHALEVIVAELRLHEADTDGNASVDFVEFMAAFKRRALQEPLTSTKRAEASFERYLGELQAELNRRVLLLVQQFAEVLQ